MKTVKPSRKPHNLLCADELRFISQNPNHFISSDPETEGMRCRFFDPESGHHVILPLIENVRLALKEIDVTLAWDDFSRFAEVSGDGMTAFNGVLNDISLRAIRFKLEDKFGILIQEGNLLSMLNDIAHANRFDPLKQYFSDLNWDGKERAINMLHKYVNAEDTPLNQAFSERLLLGLAARAFFPGIKMDEVVTLVGGQGTGKSSFCRALTPIGETAFTDQVVIGSSPKIILEQTRGKALCEHSEDYRGKYGEQQRKACLSSCSDQAREAYGKTAIEVPRRFLFISTTNSDTPVQDPTGARREWIVAVSGQMKALLPKERDQLFAEVMQKHIAPVLASGLTETEQRKQVRSILMLPTALWDAQAAVANSFRAVPEHFVSVKLALAALDWPHEVFKTELLERVSLQNGQIMSKKNLDSLIGAVMLWAGYTSKRKKKNKKQYRVYVWEQDAFGPQSAFDDYAPNCVAIDDLSEKM